MPEDELNVKEFADEIDVSYATALKYVHKNFVRANWKGGSWRIPRAEVDHVKKYGVPRDGKERREV